MWTNGQKIQNKIYPNEASRLKRERAVEPPFSRFPPVCLRAGECLQWSGEFGWVDQARGLGGATYNFTREIPILRKYHLTDFNFLLFIVSWTGSLQLQSSPVFLSDRQPSVPLTFEQQQ